MSALDLRNHLSQADKDRWRYARVDRRPLDPPPAVLLKLFYIYNPGTNRETEKEVENYESVPAPLAPALKILTIYVFSDLQNLGLLCNVDLFPAPPPDDADKSIRDEKIQQPESSSTNQIPYASTSTCSPDSQQHYSHSDSNLYADQSTPVPMLTPPRLATYPAYTEYPNVVTHIGNYPIVESSKCTNALVGATFVQPANVDYKGKKSLMFVFAVSGTIFFLLFEMCRVILKT